MEKSIEIEGIDPIVILGINNEKLSQIKLYFPKLKMIARGTTLKIIGSEKEISRFDDNYSQLLDHYNKYKRLTKSNIERILEGGGSDILSNEEEILVYGNKGTIIKAETANQRKMVKLADKNDMLFVVGPAGTGKTYTSVALAVRALKNKEVKRIILTRPAVEAGESLGFLPGDMKDKLDPYMQPLYDALRDMFPAEKLADFIETGVIQIAPLAFMRGRTLDRAFVILDESQNATKAQFKMFLTRMGKSARFIITGDQTQVDLPSNQKSGLEEALEILKDVKGIGQVYLDGKDVIRHQLVKEIITAYDTIDNKSKNK